MENEQTQKYQNFISAQNFPEDPKNKWIRILYSKKYDEHTYYFPVGGELTVHMQSSFAFCMTKKLFPCK